MTCTQECTIAAEQMHHTDLKLSSHVLLCGTVLGWLDVGQLGAADHAHGPVKGMMCTSVAVSSSNWARSDSIFHNSDSQCIIMGSLAIIMFKHGSDELI